MIIDQRELFLFASLIAGWYDKDHFHQTIQTGSQHLTTFLVIALDRKKAPKLQLIPFCVPLRSAVMRVIASATHRLLNTVLEI